MRKTAYNLLEMHRNGYIQYIYLPIKTVKRIYRTKCKDLERAQRRPTARRERFPAYTTGFDRTSGPDAIGVINGQPVLIDQKTTEEPVHTQPIYPGGSGTRRSSLFTMLKSIFIQGQKV